MSLRRPGKADPRRVAALVDAVADRFIRLGPGEVLQIYSEGRPDASLTFLDPADDSRRPMVVVSWNAWGCLDLTFVDPEITAKAGAGIVRFYEGEPAFFTANSVLAVLVGGVTVTFGATAEDFAADIEAQAGSDG